MSLPKIEVLDVDGALREADEAVAGDTRSAFFRKAALGGGAVLSSGAIMGMLPELAAAKKPSAKNDLAILNFALTLEYLESEFYKEAVSHGALSGDVLALAKIVSSHEATHVSALRHAINAARGGRPVKKPKFDFQGTTKDQAKFVPTAFALENTGVTAYLGQVRNFKNSHYLATAATIVTVEARHASAFAVVQGKQPFATGKNNSITPGGAFDRRYSKHKILNIVDSLHFIKS